MKLEELKNKKILILGFGREGVSSYKFLRRHFRNQKIGVADEKTLNQFEKEYKTILKNDKNLELSLGKNYLKVLDKYEVIVKTPGINLDKKLIEKLDKKNILLTSNLNIFLANIKGRVIGVTGSKGKGTTATLIYKILKAAGRKTYLVGNIGQPFLDFINQDSKNTIYVAELSSFHLEMIRGKLDVGVILSFFPEHLKEHGSVNNYFQAKMNIVRHLKKAGVFIYNRKLEFILSNELRRVTKDPGIRAVAYETLPPSRLGQSKFHTHLLGEHNLLNISAAIQVAKLFKVKDRIILKVIKNFKGLAYRLEYVGEFKGIKFYSDTLGTTPEATTEAIRALKPATLIVGGSAKGAGLVQFKKLAGEIVKNKIKTLIALPNEGVKIAWLVNKIKKANKPHILKVKNMQTAVRAAYKYTQAGESVVLSPAAASFDQYRDYADKGDDFKKQILNYK
jgi:UDP-N-acetylmuramoylalanine--D-glutamate ligase